MMGLAIASNSSAQDQALTILTEVAPPFQVKLPNGEMGGNFVEAVREIQRRVNNADPIKEVSWARGYQQLLTKPNTVLFGVARNAQRDPLFQWVGPFTEVVYGLYVRADAKFVLKTLDDAKQLKFISVYHDDVRDQLLTKAGFTNLDRTYDHTANVRKLMAGRIDAFASSNTFIDEQMATAGVPRNLVRQGLAIGAAQTWIAFSRETPAATVNAWRQALQAMKKDGTFERLMKKDNPTWTSPRVAVTEFRD